MPYHPEHTITHLQVPRLFWPSIAYKPDLSLLRRHTHITEDLSSTVLVDGYFDSLFPAPGDLIDVVFVDHINPSQRTIAAASTFVVASINPVHVLPFMGIEGGGDWPVTIWNFGGIGDEVADDTAAQVAGWAWSAAGGDVFNRTYAPQSMLVYPAGKYLLGIPGSTTAPLLIADGPGPVIWGQGEASRIVRKPGYGKPGLNGGGGFRLIDMVNGTAVATGLELHDLGIGNDDPSLSVPNIGGHSINLKMRRSKLVGLTFWDSNGQALVFSGNDNLIQGLRSTNANVRGGTFIRVGFGSRNLIEDCNGEPADDGLQLNIGEGDIDVDDLSNKIARENTFRNNHIDAKQGSHFAALMGSRRGAIRNPLVAQAKARLNDPTYGTGVQIRSRNANPSIGHTCMVASATGGGGLAAGDVNGLRSVLVADFSDSGGNDSDFLISHDGTITSNNVTVGNNTTVQFIRIGTTNGSPVVRLRIINHGVAPVGTLSYKISGWATVANITAADVAGMRTGTYVDADHIDFTADANANATLSVATNWAAASVTVALFTQISADGILFDRITGSSGDNAATGKGGFGRKMLLTESLQPCTVSIVDCETRHDDTTDQCCMRILSYSAPIKLKLMRDRIRTPRGAAYFMEANLFGFGVDPDAEINMKDCELDAPSLTDTPTILMDGGKLIIRGGVIHGNGLVDVIRLANDYTLASYDGNSRVVTVPTMGIAGSYLFMKVVDIEGTLIDGIGNGKFGLDLGNVQWGRIVNVTFRPAAGATTWGCIKMRTPSGGDIGTTNVAIGADCDFDTCPAANIVSNYQTGKGNSRGDLIESVTAGGTANALTVTPVPALRSLTTGRQLLFVVGSANNTGAATLDASALGAKAIQKQTAAGLVALTGNEIRTGSYYNFLYDSTLAAGAGAWILRNPSP